MTSGAKGFTVTFGISVKEPRKAQNFTFSLISMTIVLAYRLHEHREHETPGSFPSKGYCWFRAIKICAVRCTPVYLRSASPPVH